MKIKFSIHGENTGAITLFREAGDPKFHGIRHAKGEHNLFFVLKKFLNTRGFDVIKKRAHKDGHMIGDEFQPYVRTRKHTTQSPHIYIHSEFYALRGANEDWNEGEVYLKVTGNIHDKQPDWGDRIIALGAQHGFEVSDCRRSLVSVG